MLLAVGYLLLLVALVVERIKVIDTPLIVGDLVITNDRLAIGIAVLIPVCWIASLVLRVRGGHWLAGAHPRLRLVGHVLVGTVTTVLGVLVGLAAVLLGIIMPPRFTILEPPHDGCRVVLMAVDGAHHTSVTGFLDVPGTVILVPTDAYWNHPIGMDGWSITWQGSTATVTGPQDYGRAARRLTCPA